MSEFSVCFAEFQKTNEKHGKSKTRNPSENFHPSAVMEDSSLIVGPISSAETRITIWQSGDGRLAAPAA